MKLSVALVGSLAVPALGAETGNSAIEKVIEMLTNMQTKGKEEMDKEKAAFAAYNTWALGVQQDKSADVEDGDTLSKKLEGLILAEQGSAAEAEEKIEEYADVLAKEKENLAAISKTRVEEHSAFISEEQDLTDSIFACDKAKEVLESVPEKIEAKTLFFYSAEQDENKKLERQIANSNGIPAIDTGSFPRREIARVGFHH